MNASQQISKCHNSRRHIDDAVSTGEHAFCTDCQSSVQVETTWLPSFQQPHRRLKELRGPIETLKPADRDFHYTVESCLGGGGVGIVYRARRSTDDLAVALKMPAHINDPVGAASIRQETDALLRLDHPNIVRLLDAGETAEGDPYLVMELLEGETLDQLLRRTGPLSVDKAAEICFKLAEALEHAHLSGLVHCDLKPSNIFITRGDAGDHVRVIDFGIAENQSESAAIEGKVRCATLLYMSPEQSLKKGLTGSSDVYQLGLILFETLYGELPFQITAESAVKYRLSGDLVPAVCSRDGSCVVPMGMKALVLRALARDPRDRHSTTREFIEELRQFVQVPQSTSDDD